MTTEEFDGYYQELDDARDDYSQSDVTPDRNTKIYQGCRYRVVANPSQDIPRKRNAKAKVGTECRCPMCHKKFIKKTYQQRFCCIKCKNNFHNKRQRYY